MTDRVCYARSPDGVPIAEIELAPHETDQLTELAVAALAHGARMLCVYSTAELSGAGFQRREGYRRLTVPLLSDGCGRDRSSGNGAITWSSRPIATPLRMRSSSACQTAIAGWHLPG